VQVQVMVAQAGDDGPASAVDDLLTGEPAQGRRYRGDAPGGYPDVCPRARQLSIVQEKAG
jgi:hypothetical protein